MSRRASGPRARVVPAALAVGVVVLALMVGCSGIPTSGPVRQGASVAAEPDQPNTRSIGQPPRDGMTQQQIVEGFIFAAASFEDDHAVARLFLTSDAAKAWNPALGATIFDGSTASPKLNGPADVTFSAARIANLSQQGEYVSAGGVVTEDFKLRKVDGQWRITTPPPGLMLTPSDLARAYRLYDIYFPDPARTVLVPNQVLLPVGPGTSTALVRALVAGPTPWLAPAVFTAIPTGTKLVVDSAPVVDGVVQVDLTAPAATVTGREAQALSAQVVWTLRQLGGVTGVRITVDGTPLRGVAAVQDIAAWPQWNPDGVLTSQSADLAALYSDKNRLFALVNGLPQSLLGQVGDGGFPLYQPGVSFDGTQVGALDANARSLFVARIGVNAKVSPAVVTGATHLTAPTWDRNDNLWTVDDRPSGPVFWVDSLGAGAGGTGAQRAAAEDLPRGRVVAMRIARDGARVALIVKRPSGIGSDLYLGRVERGPGRLVVSGFRLVRTVLTDTSDVAWLSADRLVVLGRVTPGGVRQPLVIDLSGATAQSLGLIDSGSTDRPGLLSITAIPGHDILASADNGSLYRYTGSGWDELGTGQAPSYPG
jgi:hypothetical protein